MRNLLLEVIGLREMLELKMPSQRHPARPSTPAVASWQATAAASNLCTAAAGLILDKKLILALDQDEDYKAK